MNNQIIKTIFIGGDDLWVKAKIDRKVFTSANSLMRRVFFYNRVVNFNMYLFLDFFN